MKRVSFESPRLRAFGPTVPRRDELVSQHFSGRGCRRLYNRNREDIRRNKDLPGEDLAVPREQFERLYFIGGELFTLTNHVREPVHGQLARFHRSDPILRRNGLSDYYI